MPGPLVSPKATVSATAAPHSPSKEDINKIVQEFSQVAPTTPAGRDLLIESLKGLFPPPTPLEDKVEFRIEYSGTFQHPLGETPRAGEESEATRTLLVTPGKKASKDLFTWKEALFLGVSYAGVVFLGILGAGAGGAANRALFNKDLGSRHEEPTARIEV